MHLLEGGPYGDALLIRVHHAVGDGMTLLKTSLDLVKGNTPEERERASRTFLDRFMEPITDAVETTQTITDWFKTQAEQGLPSTDDLILSAEQAMELGLKMSPLVRDPDTILTKPLTRRKEISWTPPIPTREFKRVSRAFGVSINDIAIAVVAGALRRYFIYHEEPVPRTLHASVPIYLGSATSIETGNHFGLVLAPLPLGEPNPRKRILRIHRAMDRLKQSPEASLVSGAFTTAGLLPPGIVGKMFDEVSRKASVVVSSIPGPPYELKVGDTKVRHIVPLVPLSGHIGLGIAIASYNRKLSFGIQADGGRIQPELNTFVEMLLAELALLTAVGEEQQDGQAKRCAALTVEGKRCRNRPRQGHMTCWAHRNLERI